MSDYIKRDDAEQAIARYLSPVFERAEQGARRVLQNIPSADVVEVVRCKDCKWAGRDEHCPAIEMYMVCGGNGYCSYGERKEQEHE